MNSTIKGQINGFDFQSVAQGVDDAALGGNVEAIFTKDWKAVVRATLTSPFGNATPGSPSVSGFQMVAVEAPAPVRLLPPPPSAQSGRSRPDLDPFICRCSSAGRAAVL